MQQQKFTIEYTIHNGYANNRHIHVKTRTRIYSEETKLILYLLKDNPDLNTRKIFKNLCMYTLSESFLSLQEYKEKTIKITSSQILFSNYA